MSEHWKTIARTAYEELTRRGGASGDEVAGLLCTAAHVAAKRTDELHEEVRALRAERDRLAADLAAYNGHPPEVIQRRFEEYAAEVATRRAQVESLTEANGALTAALSLAEAAREQTKAEAHERAAEMGAALSLAREEAEGLRATLEHIAASQCESAEEHDARTCAERWPNETGCDPCCARAALAPRATPAAPRTEEDRTP